MSSPCLSCPTACNGSLLPSTLDLNTCVAADKELHIGLTLLFFFLNTILAPEHFLLVSADSLHIWVPAFSFLFLAHKPFFVLAATRVIPRWIPYSRGGQPSSIKSQTGNTLAFAVHTVSAEAPRLCLLPCGSGQQSIKEWRGCVSGKVHLQK